MRRDVCLSIRPQSGIARQIGTQATAAAAIKKLPTVPKHANTAYGTPRRKHSPTTVEDPLDIAATPSRQAAHEAGP
jgi:hypothetical protein